MNLSFGQWAQPLRRRIASIREAFPRRFFLDKLKKLPGLKSVPERWLGRILIAAAVLIIAAGIGVSVSLATIWPLPYDRKTREVTIPYASSVREVAEQLQTHGIIRNAQGFVWYVRLAGQTRALRAGVYRLHPGCTFKELVEQLKTGSPPVCRLTIPEGFTAKEITDLLAAKNLIRPKRFQALLRDKTFLSRELKGFGEITSGEGFLFPDTYEFAYGTSEEEILTAFFRRFREIWHEEEGKSDRKRDPFQALIMASIVEKEAKAAEERPVIAGVFYNRLSRRMPLESCATVQYALGRHKPKLYYKDLGVDSKYNTYKYLGLPPGPICNPGRASIDAALRPVSHPYLYFVAKDDGRHVFSKTYREHLEARRKLGN